MPINPTHQKYSILNNGVKQPTRKHTDKTTVNSCHINLIKLCVKLLLVTP